MDLSKYPKDVQIAIVNIEKKLRQAFAQYLLETNQDVKSQYLVQQSAYTNCLREFGMTLEEGLVIMREIKQAIGYYK